MEKMHGAVGLLQSCTCFQMLFIGKPLGGGGGVVD